MAKLDAVKINSLTHANRKAGDEVVSQVIIKMTCDAKTNEEGIAELTKLMVRDENLIVDAGTKQVEAKV